MDIDDDLEGARNGGSKQPPPYDAPRAGASSSSNARRDASPLPAPVPTKPAGLPRESLDGETIFAVGDEDKMSDFDDDDEDDEDERKGLAGKST
jgi:hypothetical protein